MKRLALLALVCMFLVGWTHPIPYEYEPEQPLADCVVIDRRDTAWVLPSINGADRTIMYTELVSVCDELPPEMK